jgi:hypothetical protein
MSIEKIIFGIGKSISTLLLAGSLCFSGQNSQAGDINYGSSSRRRDVMQVSLDPKFDSLLTILSEISI